MFLTVFYVLGCDEDSLAIFEKKLTVKGMHVRLVSTSQTACAICIPKSPKAQLKIRRIGIKNNPFLNEERNVALNLYPMLWNIMLLQT